MFFAATSQRETLSDHHRRRNARSLRCAGQDCSIPGTHTASTQQKKNRKQHNVASCGILQLCQCCSFLQHKSCELVLIVDDDASLLNANIDGVLAVIVPHAISLAAAFHLFAPAWWHADLNINAFRSATAAWIVTGTRIIDPNNLGNGTWVHFPLVDIPHTGKQRFRCSVNIHCAVQNVSAGCGPEPSIAMS